MTLPPRSVIANSYRPGTGNVYVRPTSSPAPEMLSAEFAIVCPSTEIRTFAWPELTERGSWATNATVAPDATELVRPRTSNVEVSKDEPNQIWPTGGTFAELPPPGWLQRR